MANLPSPSGILTNSPARSRAGSRNRLKRKTKSHVAIHLPADATATSTIDHYDDSMPLPSGAVSSHGFGGVLRPTQSRSANASRRSLHLALPETDSSWLVQTGLALTESGRESKGQSWLGKRESSTSLVNLQSAIAEGWEGSGTAIREERRERPTRSRRGTPAGSRVGSRAGSRTRRGRRELHMTSVMGSEASLVDKARVEEDYSPVHPKVEEEEEDVVPDWADEKTQEEVAAQVQTELVDEFGYEDGDPYGMLDFEGQVDFEFDEEEEAEVKREFARTRRRLFGGGWIDDVVDAMVGLESVEGVEMGTVEVGQADADTKAKPKNVMRRDEEVVDESKLEIPPEEGGVWEDVKWLGRLMSKSLM